jgi:hypothetical protein
MYPPAMFPGAVNNQLQYLPAPWRMQENVPTPTEISGLTTGTGGAGGGDGIMQAGHPLVPGPQRSAFPPESAYQVLQG